ncbi:MAG: FAD-binding oxidoreductase [Pseudomonadota bacterium]
MFSLKKPIETREHTTSYYAASANWQTDYAQLRGEVDVDVAVIGGGFSGINTALELAERGYRVAVVEANRVAWGASGRNGGQVIGGIGHSLEQFERQIGQEGIKSIYAMGVECVDIIRARVEKYTIDCDLTWGYCDVAIKPRHMRELEEEKQYQEDMGCPHALELLDKDRLSYEVSSDRYIGGLMNRNGAGHCQPMNLCLGEAQAAEQLGVQIYEQSRVTRLVTGKKPRVETESGAVNANFVVLCGNAYLGNLVPKLAARVLPASSSIIATTPLRRDQIDATMPGNRAVCDLNTALDYFRLSADKRLLFGGLSNYTGLEPRDVSAVMREKMVRVFPSMADVAIEFAWSGYIGIGLNRMPQVGRIEDNVFFIQAFSGHGVAPTHMMARITAQMIAGQAERFDVFARIKHHPFPGGKFLRRPALALGMLYYRLKDLL